MHRIKPLQVSFSENPVVVLIHGLGRTVGCWRSLRKSLDRKGFTSVAVDYPSTRFDIPHLVSGWIDPMLSRVFQQALQHGTEVHIVTHSMGGILLRYWLQSNRLPKTSRVVMLAPPNRGSEVIDRLEKFAWFHRVMGPAAMQLATPSTSWVNALPNWTSDARLGIIAGSRSADPWFNRWFDGLHDGKVAVDRTRLEGCHDITVLPVTHTWMMNDIRVHDLAEKFVQRGDFGVNV